MKPFHLFNRNYRKKMNLKIPLFLFLLYFFCSCHHQQEQIVNTSFIDSLITNYSQSSVSKANEQEILFWKSRINTDKPGMVNEAKYASALAIRFRINGDIKDIKAADSVLWKIDSVFNHKEASVYLSMVSHCISQHKFKDADIYLQKAKSLGIKPYESYAASFDVDFELGRYLQAEYELKTIQSPSDFGYFFRRSKWEHYNGNLDSAIAAMRKAYELAGSDITLEQAALSNTADLYLHAGDIQKAADMYKQSIQLDAADMHSIMGLGWIALVHDKNDSLAERIFHFVGSRSMLPDPLLKLEQAAEQKNDSNMQKKYAAEFIKNVSDPAYGNMYNKYLIDLYTGIMNDPAKAESIAQKEISSRPTPQTYAWYVWCLFCNHKENEAYKTFEEYVSGKPLEGPELYWMGKMMLGLNKGYNAKEFFKAADKNRFDLSPGKIADLDKNLEE